MKKLAILYGAFETGVQKKAVELLSQLLLDYTLEYPVCLPYTPQQDVSRWRCIYIGTRDNNAYIRSVSQETLTQPEAYSIRVANDTAVIEGSDDAGVLYGCMDFYNRFIVQSEHPHTDRYWINPFEKEWPDFACTSSPAVRDRGIWTWGHVIYEYRSFIDNMVKLKLNTLIIWNDHPPVNAADMIAYAHDCNVKVIWGFSWFWDTKCDEIDIDHAYASSADILAKYEREYHALGGDGIYFQSFTETNQERIGGKLIAEAVTDFVNHTAEGFFAKYPDLELQFGLHANSVRHRLEYIRKVDPRIRIVWENCGSFPFSYIPKDIESFDQTCAFVQEIASLRGADDRFGVVSKGLTKLDWSAFEHLEGPVFSGTSSKWLKHNRVLRKQRIWRYLQAYWLANADKAYEMVQLMQRCKQGNLYITALVEDGMFEEQILFPVALFSEMLWDCQRDVKELISDVALRSYVEFA